MPKSSAKSNNRTVKITLGFVGTRYEGWQSQRKGRTIQEIFEKVLTQICQEPIKVTGSSRTDSGVHAEGFVAHFHTKNDLADERLHKALNFYLPQDIAVYKVKTVHAAFHARFHTRSKRYEYQIWNHPIRPLFEAPYTLWYPHKLDLVRMKQAARYIKGKHDFSAFEDKPEGEEKNRIRTIKRITFTRKSEKLLILIEGDGFLRHMIRVIIGTLLEVSRGRMTPQAVKKAIESRDRKKAGPTAKAQGLRLKTVKY